MRFDHELTRRELIESAKPHWIAALINMTTTAISTERNAATAAKNRAAQLGAAAMGRKGPGDYTPTAGLAQKAQGDDNRDFNSLGLQDLAGGQQKKSMFSGNELSPDRAATTEQDFHLFNGPSGGSGKTTADLRSALDTTYQPKAGPDFRTTDSTQPNTDSTTGNMQSNYQPESNVGVGGQNPKTDNNYAQYANALSGIAGALMQHPQIQQAQIPQAGQSNFSPTALAILAKRKQNPYGPY